MLCQSGVGLALLFLEPADPMSIRNAFTFGNFRTELGRRQCVEASGCEILSRRFVTKRKLSRKEPLFGVLDFV